MDSRASRDAQGEIGGNAGARDGGGLGPERGREIERTPGATSIREDVVRFTQVLATELEGLIARAPEQWHLLQPNWPSDYEALGTTPPPRRG